MSKQGWAIALRVFTACLLAPLDKRRATVGKEALHVPIAIVETSISVGKIPQVNMEISVKLISLASTGGNSANSS